MSAASSRSSAFSRRFQRFDPASERDGRLFALPRRSQCVTQYVLSPHKHCAFRTLAPNEAKSSCELMCRPQCLVLIDLTAAGCDRSRPNRKSFQQCRFARSVFPHQKCHAGTELQSLQVAKQRQRPWKCIVRNHSRPAVDGRQEQIIHESLSALVYCTALPQIYGSTTAC
jgi:hypothetical protein